MRDLSKALKIVSVAMTIHGCGDDMHTDSLKINVVEAIYKTYGCNVTTTEGKGVDLRPALTQYFIQNSL